MPTKEYVKTARKARQFLLDAYAGFADGDDCRPACEKLWQAAAHAIAAVAQQRGWPCGSAEARYAAVSRLAEELDEPLLSSCYSAVKMFRDNAEFEFMEDFQLQSSRPRARYFIERMLSLLEPSAGGGAKD